ncbi:hypothetical protein AMK16_25725 [Streptomyces sp. CB00455]|uniref:MarR family winged helix-turn-helix transcriptional regulator n=1 Tax=Streptomyces sp. CB00455 TaxID=1703927 RepID=UPI00093B96C4|nr:MarR family transcriptional regulator [Streptomyces sp. CB00455]OKK16118.1 hypothetical protein AMK16_25725 [Streptomyces sp. CB00455]
MPKAFHSLTQEQEAFDACAVAEMLEVLWGRHQEAPGEGLPPSQLRALTILERRPGINLRDLGEALGSTPPSISRLCDRLEAAGLVQRSRVRTNRREVELSLSRRGRAVLAQTRARRAQSIAEVLQRMSPRRRQALGEGLSAFRDAALTHVRLDARDDRVEDGDEERDGDRSDGAEDDLPDTA